MERTNKIDIADLRRIVDAIFNHIECDLKVETVQLDDDYYWMVLESELYTIEAEKPVPGLGSLFDDLEFLLPLLKNDRQAIPLMLMHVAPLLRYIAYKVKE